ncbi:hypothetical protein LEP1GSC192_0183 [Leptospira sp. B5-022]|nr:hypothetical protein LEP1GSC192_0183 [Leptospira sp. B5-022]
MLQFDYNLFRSRELISKKKYTNLKMEGSGVRILFLFYNFVSEFIFLFLI